MAQPTSSSDSGEPSTPTTTGPSAAPCAWTTITGQCACEATWDTVDPRIAEETEPWPLDPIATMTAVRLCSTRTPAIDSRGGDGLDRYPGPHDDVRRLRDQRRPRVRKGHVDGRRPRHGSGGTLPGGHVGLAVDHPDAEVPRCRLPDRPVQGRP